LSKLTENIQRFKTIDLHTEGEPLRVVVDGFPELPGATILEKRAYAKSHHDDLRRALMWEPRGHADMYGAIPVSPTTVDGDIGVLFMHNEGFSTMCGHGIIGLVKVGVEHDLFEISDLEQIRIDTPAGRVTAKAHMDKDTVSSVSFLNVPSFVSKPKLEIKVQNLGTITLDLAFGGAFYAYVETKQLGLDLEPANFGKIINIGMQIKDAVTQQVEISHPTGSPDLNFLYGTIFVNLDAPNCHSRNVCVFAEGEVDRSPTGTGVSGRAAIHHQRGDIGLDQWIQIESLIGSRFKVCCRERLMVGNIRAVIPEVQGTAWITGQHEFMIDPADPLSGGFVLR
jgi:proline racemase